MKTRDILELRRRFTKDSCTFTRLAGCYVDADKNKVTTFNHTFLNLADEEFYKYLEIAKQVFKGKIENKMGDNYLVRSFERPVERGTQAENLLQLRADMKNDDALDAFFDRVIDFYDSVGNYLILLFHDAYDVITKTSDNNEIDESEEVYEYLLCAICPVSLSAPGLQYREDQNMIAPRIRDWVVGKPETAFLYPAFTDRQEDREHMLFYTKDTTYPHHELMEHGFGCTKQMTGTEKRKAFESCAIRALDEELGEDMLMRFNEELWSMPANEDETPETNGTKIDLEKLEEVLVAAGEPLPYREEIAKLYTKEFRDNWPEARWLFNKKYYKKAVTARQRLALKELLAAGAKELERVTGEESELTKRMLAAVTR